MGPRLSLDANHRLCAELPDGTRHIDVTPVRAFPLTAPSEHIALVDSTGHEIWAFPTLGDLEPEQRKTLSSVLERREFLPTILEIHSVQPRSEPSRWSVTTDRGAVAFTLPSEDNVRRLPGGGALVVDDCGVRYRIAAIDKLNAESQRILKRYL